MPRASIRDVLLLQQRELEHRYREPYVRRSLEPRALESSLIQVILGPRRAGKSFFAVHALRSLGPFGYVDFDDERLLAGVDYDEIVNALDSLYGRPPRLFLDEVQNVPRWEAWVNRLQRQGRRVVVTGSNSNLLSQELATHLTGRHARTLVFPFSFAERLRWMGADLTTAERKEALARHLEEGGFPEPLLRGMDRRDYLSTLLDAVLYKDVVRRFRVRALQGLHDLADYLLANFAREYSFRTLSGVTRCKSPTTAEKYLRFLEEAFVFFSVQRFSWKVREQISSNKKVYCVDNGLLTSRAFRFSSDRGRLLENLVAIALRKRELTGKAAVYYWRDPQSDQEVDFVVKEGLKVRRLIQVCADVRDPKTQAREVRALVQAGRALRCNDLVVLTEDTEEVSPTRWFGARRSIRYVPLWKWLSSQD